MEGEIVTPDLIRGLPSSLSFKDRRIPARGRDDVGGGFRDVVRIRLFALFDPAWACPGGSARRVRPRSPVAAQDPHRLALVLARTGRRARSDLVLVGRLDGPQYDPGELPQPALRVSGDRHLLSRRQHRLSARSRGMARVRRLFFRAQTPGPRRRPHLQPAGPRRAMGPRARPVREPWRLVLDRLVLPPARPGDLGPGETPEPRPARL